MRRSRTFVGLIAWILVSTVNGFAPKFQRRSTFAAVGNREPSPRWNPPKEAPFQLQSAADRTKEPLWGRDIARFSFRRFFQRILRFRIPRQHLHRLAALALAACVWMRLGIPLVHAATGLSTDHPPMERLAEYVPSSSLSRVIAEGNANTSATRAPDPAVEQPTLSITSSRWAVKSKLGTALVGTALVGTSAGYIYSSFHANGMSHKEHSNGARAEPEEGSGKKRDMVKKVWERAKSKSSKFGVDADTYIQSLQREKNEISSALDKLKQQLESAGKADEMSRSQVAKPTVAAMTAKRKEKDAPVFSTNTKLPLMTPKYIEARKHPKSPAEEERLKKKYMAYKDVGERAFAILVDLGMIEVTGNVDDATTIPPPASAAADAEDEPFQ